MYLPPKKESQEWVGVLIAIPEPWVSQLTEARLSFGDEAANRVPAHITLIPPIAVEVSQREEVLAHLQGIASRFSPFRLTVKGADTFLPISPVAFMEIAVGKETCIDLAEEIRSGPLDFSPRFPYHPHVTLAQGMPEPTLEAAVKFGDSFEASWMTPGFRLDCVSATGAYTSKAIFDFLR